MVAAIDQHIADAGLAHFAEGDLLRIGRHSRLLRCHRASSGLLERALSCYNLQGGNARGAQMDWTLVVGRVLGGVFCRGRQSKTTEKAKSTNERLERDTRLYRNI